MPPHGPRASATAQRVSFLLYGSLPRRDDVLSRGIAVEVHVTRQEVRIRVVGADGIRWMCTC